jgi:NADH:ubiquinone oxidoreductase subunit 4 (subunit M)
MIALSLIAVIYIGLVALVQTDMKKLVAYSSISHMGFVTLGMFMFTGSHLNQWAVEGALVQMVSHGFVSGACSCVSACCTTACTAATSPTTVVWPTRCRSLLPS